MGVHMLTASAFVLGLPQDRTSSGMRKHTFASWDQQACLNCSPIQTPVVTISLMASSRCHLEDYFWIIGLYLGSFPNLALMHTEICFERPSARTSLCSLRFSDLLSLNNARRDFASSGWIDAATKDADLTSFVLCYSTFLYYKNGSY